MTSWFPGFADWSAAAQNAAGQMTNFIIKTIVNGVHMLKCHKKCGIPFGW